MGLLKAALFASIVLGATGTPLDESKAWQNNSTTTTSTSTNTTTTSDEDGKWTVFAPVTQVSGWDLDVPGVTSSPVTQHTKASLEVPDSQPSATETPTAKPIIQPSESSLLIPVATVSNGKTYVTIAPSAHLEHPGTILVRPEGGTASPTLGIVGSELVDLPANTGTAATNNDQGDSGSSAGPEGNAEQESPAAILVGDSTLRAGGSPVTLDGTTYSLVPTGSAVAINGNTVSFSTNSRGQVVPVETTASGQSDSDTNDADTEALGKLSAVSAPASATATGEGAQGTTSATLTTASGNSGSSDDDGNADATGTSTSDSAPATQSDNAGAAAAVAWPLSAIMGAAGLLAVVL